MIIVQAFFIIIVVVLYGLVCTQIIIENMLHYTSDISLLC